MKRFGWFLVAVGTAFLCMAVILAFYWDRGPAVPAVVTRSPAPTTVPPPAAEPTPAESPALPGGDPAAGALLRVTAVRFVAAWQSGALVGGEVWLAQLRTVATPELVRVVALTDPADITTAEVMEVRVDSIGVGGTGTVYVRFRDGVRKLLHVAPGSALVESMDRVGTGP